MKNLVLLFAVLLTLASCSTESVDEIEQDFIMNYTPEHLQQSEMLAMINEHRERMGLNSVSPNQPAFNEASQHNNYMISRGKISHDNFQDRANKLTGETGALGVAENVGKGNISVQQAFLGFLDSPEHRKNIEGDFTHVGISIKTDPETGEFYHAQIFIKL